MYFLERHNLSPAAVSELTNQTVTPNDLRNWRHQGLIDASGARNRAGRWLYSLQEATLFAASKALAGFIPIDGPRIDAGHMIYRASFISVRLTKFILDPNGSERFGLHWNSDHKPGVDDWRADLIEKRNLIYTPLPGSKTQIHWTDDPSELASINAPEVSVIDLKAIAERLPVPLVEMIKGADDD